MYMCEIFQFEGKKYQHIQQILVNIFIHYYFFVFQNNTLQYFGLKKGKTLERYHTINTVM